MARVKRKKKQNRLSPNSGLYCQIYYSKNTICTNTLGYSFCENSRFLLSGSQLCFKIILVYRPAMTMPSIDTSIKQSIKHDDSEILLSG